MTTDVLRVVGLTPDRTGKTGGIFKALGQHADLVATIRPALPKFDYYLNKLRHFHPDLVYWRSRAGLNPWIFRRRSEIAEQQLQQFGDDYDLIVQMHTLFAPGLRQPNRPFVITTDNTYAISERYYQLWAPLRGRQRDERIRLEKLTYRHAAFLFPRSEFVRRSMIEDYEVPPEKVIAIGGGANLFVPSLVGKSYDAPIALFIGDDFKRKGGRVLLQAWEQVRQQVPGAELWIAGPKQPRGVDIPGIRWLGFVRGIDALQQLYSRARVFVMPSLFEPWGFVFQEAMGHGLPCIGTSHCAMPEIIEHGTTGLLVPPHEPEPLADALALLLNDQSRAETMGRRAHAAILASNTWDHVVQRLLPYLRMAVGGAAPSGQQYVTA